MRKERESLSGGEWKVMSIVWDFQECDARQVCQQAQKEYDWAESTTKTFLRRVVNKGYLKAKRVGNSFLYTPIRSSFEPLRLAVDNLLRYAKDETIAPLLTHIVKKRKLSREDLAELRAFLDQCAQDESE